ncbi:MAG TPA: lysophospholipid acyltransferase family protein [Bacteroidales bacterium]|nr:lysophospholipid acyltransferase family protein [Bacteroidales bacterium]
MNVLAFRMAYGFVRAISFLPLDVLYLMAVPLRFLAINVLGYRRKVVVDNLRRAFPGKSETDIQHIAGDFYRYFSELMVETIKVMDFSEASLAERIRFKNPEIIDQYFAEGKSVVAIAAHYGNWEWLQGLTGSIPHKPIAVYKPLNNGDMDRVLTQQRSRFGAELVSMRDIIRTLRRYHREKQPTLSMYISDQSPVWEEIQYWMPFLNQSTPVYLGPEKIAREFGMAVVYLRMHVVRRGYYEVEIIPVTGDARREKDHVVTNRHVNLLEKTIMEKPEYWLWSHRRWKLTRKRELQEKQGIYKFDGPFLRKQN